MEWTPLTTILIFKSLTAFFWFSLFNVSILLFFEFFHFIKLFFLNYFNWKIITLQYCNGFCHIATWIGSKFTCVPPQSWNPFPYPSHPNKLASVHLFVLLCLHFHPFFDSVFYFHILSFHVLVFSCVSLAWLSN